MRVTATLLLWGMCCLGAQASSITYITPGGSTDPAGEPLDAAVTFTTSPGMITVTLNNLEPNPKSDGQNLSDLLFTVSTGVTGASFVSGTAGAITINGAHMITNPMTLTTTGQIGWVLSKPTSTEITLDVLSGPGHAGPKHTIIGPPNMMGVYSNANGSIAGSPSHNPFISEIATWEIHDPTATSDTTITKTTFSFGTKDMADEIVGIPAAPPVPEPSSMMLLGSGLLVLTQVLRRKLSKGRKAQS